MGPQARTLSIKHRILLFSVVGLGISIAMVLMYSVAHVREAIDRRVTEQQRVTTLVARHLDHVLQSQLTTLSGLSLLPGVDLHDADWEPERVAIHGMVRTSLFRKGIFLQDAQGAVPLREPMDALVPAVAWSAVSLHKPLVTTVTADGAGGARWILMVLPLRDGRGGSFGIIGGLIDPAQTGWVTALFPAAADLPGMIEVLDRDGVAVWRTGWSDTTAVTTAHDDVSATVTEAALAVAPWRVSVRQPRSAAWRSVMSLQTRAVLLALLLLLVGLGFALGMARSVTRPIAVLQRSAQQIADGDFARPVPLLGGDELGVLSRHFEVMRVRLFSWHRELEGKIRERTQKIITAQEEERKRIARELHDDLAQKMAALLLKLELQRPEEARALAIQVLDDMQRLMRNLRPSILDDVGLNSAIRWLVKHNLTATGVATQLFLDESHPRLAPALETAVFRVVQEAVANVCRHAAAQRVVICTQQQHDVLHVTIEDDGCGFDPAAAASFGIAGMQERVALVDGRMQIDAVPGRGTKIRVEVPLR